MRDDNGGHPNLLAVVMGIVVGMLTFAALWMLSTIGAPHPEVQWVHMKDPTKAGYDSYVPCVRTSWMLPNVTCYPTESRSELLTVHGTDPHIADCRLPDPVDPEVDCRVGR